MTDQTETLARGPELAPREPQPVRQGDLAMGTNRARVAELYRRKQAEVCGEILLLEEAIARQATFPLVFDDRA